MKKLTKSREDQVLFGVLGGLGEYFNVDPVFLRVIFVFLTFIGVGSTIPLYIILALVMPDGPKTHSSSKPKKDWRQAFQDQKDGYTHKKRKPAEDVEEGDWSDF